MHRNRLNDLWDLLLVLDSGNLNREIACFQLLFDERQEALGIGAIDHAMIEAEGKIGHPANADKVVAIRQWSSLWPVFQSCRLRESPVAAD